MSNGRPRTRAFYNATQTMWALKEQAHDNKYDPIRTRYKGPENTQDFTNYLQYEADYKPRVEDADPARDEILHYTRELRRILEAPPTSGVQPVPSEIMPGVYLGSVSHAENIKLLTKMGIHFILNCAGIAAIRPQRQQRYDFRPDADIRGYEELPAEDSETYDITHHFPKAFRFIDASRRHGRVLVYCPDVNRSGAVGLAYLVSKGTALLDAAKIVKNCRKGALFNRGFMHQVAQYARDRGQLETNVPYMGMQQRVRMKDRPRKSHLLRFF